mmetsp:Transcript_4966/g.7172  ORF Transcript_4966/g.7172 Transcript_4966/m.7172 type:complete len:217 (-) Transcript_4966:45-695(-)
MLSVEPHSAEIQASSGVPSPSSCRVIFSIAKLEKKLASEKLELDELCKEKNQLRKDNFYLRNELRMLKRAIAYEHIEGVKDLKREQEETSKRYDERQALCLEKNRLRQENFHLRHKLPTMRRDSIHKQTQEISDLIQQIEEMRNIYNDLQASIEITSCENELAGVINIGLKSEVKALLTRERSVDYSRGLRRVDKAKSMSHVSVHELNLSTRSSPR